MAEQKQEEKVIDVKDKKVWLIIRGCTETKGAYKIARKKGDYDKKAWDDNSFLGGMTVDLVNLKEWITKNDSIHCEYKTLMDDTLTIETVLNSIISLCEFATKNEADEIFLYYTGHGVFDSGDWCFSDGIIQLKEIIDIIAEKWEKGNFELYSDCSFSGNWALEFNKYKNQLKKGGLITGACWPGCYARDELKFGGWYTSSVQTKIRELPKNAKCKYCTNNTTYGGMKYYSGSKNLVNQDNIISINDLSDDEKNILDKYAYQLKLGISRVLVKRSMHRLGDKHLIPILFPAEDPNDLTSKSKTSKKMNKNRNRMRANVYDDSSSYQSSYNYDKAALIEMRFPVQVFVRIRPLISVETDEKHEAVKFGSKTSKKTKKKTLILKKAGSGQRNLEYKGFMNVMLPKHNNLFTFKAVVLQCVDAIFQGQICASFAYGHSGSGKTHTMFGYDTEPGMYQLFAGEMIERIKDLKDVQLEVRFIELYQSKLKDLLSDNKDELFLREAEQNLGNKQKENLFILRTRPKWGADGRMRCYGATGVLVNDEKELLDAVSEGIASRNVGNSTIHDKSSRSHVFLEFEVVTPDLQQIKTKLIDIEADLLFNKTLEGLLSMGRKKALKELENKHPAFKVAFEKAQFATLVAEAERLEQEQVHMNVALLAKRNNKNKMYLGKTMVFCDLAGNEYGRDAVGKRDKKEEAERIQINKSLSALKECIRALSSGKRSHIPYRQSPLTKYLKRYMGEKDSMAIMINNIGCSKRMTKQSINTLKYASMVANV